jgi:excisionase family DNA binding protein
VQASSEPTGPLEATEGLTNGNQYPNMNTMIEECANEFPFVQGLAKREKGKLLRAWDLFEELSRVVEQEGMLMPQAFAASALGVSRQRVYQLVEAGKLKAVMVGSERFVTGNSVVDFAKSERKTGRPVKLIDEAAAKGTVRACLNYAKDVSGLGQKKT